MTLTNRYLAGLAIVMTGGAGVALLQGPASAKGVWLALGIALGVQGPLGWWLVKSVGTEQFLAIWVGGMLTRLAVLIVTALVILPLLGWPLSPALVALAILLMSLLAVEGTVLLLEPSKAGA